MTQLIIFVLAFLECMFEHCVVLFEHFWVAEGRLALNAASIASFL